MVKILKRNVKETRKNINFRATELEYKAMKAKADRYCEGDISKWLRAAAIDYKPSETELVTKNIK